MRKRGLDRLFEPRSVAVIGASERPGSVGATVFRNLTTSGYSGAVFPVNSRRDSIAGVRAFRKLADLPEVPDLVVVATPAATTVELVEQCGQAGVGGVVVLSAGYREVGPAGVELERRLTDAARRHRPMRLLGPNCLGLIVPRLKLSASFAHVIPKAGGVAFLSQSGAVCTAVLDWAVREQIGFSTVVSIGNAVNVGFGDLIDYLALDPHTHSMLLYVETIADARRFMSAARSFTRTKPIVVYKGGRFPISAKAAASHTGALAGEDAVYEAAFERAGLVRVYELSDMVECAELLAKQRPPAGGRLAIVTNAGGPGVMAVDALIAAGGLPAELSPQTRQRLDEILPPFWSHGNPVDILGDADPPRYKSSVATVLEDSNVDAVLCLLTPQSMTEPTQAAQALIDAAGAAPKPVLAAWLGGDSVAQGIRLLNNASIPTFVTPELAVRAFMHLVRYSRNLETLYETPRSIPIEFAWDRSQLRRSLEAPDGPILSESASKALLQAYGIPTAAPIKASTAPEAVAAARRVGYPAAMKVASPQITHKTDVGGVVLNLDGDDDVLRAFDQVVEAARRHRPDASIEGVTIQKMFVAADGMELLVGSKKDPTFGPAIAVGLGGVAAEVHRDRSLGLPPLNEKLARRMLQSLRSWPLLSGYRGRRPIAVDRLVEVLIRFSYLVADHPEIAAVDVNPLLATPDEVVALDARIILDETWDRTAPPYSHLALPPYPEEFVRRVKLRDGAPLVFRPIQPQDEPKWIEMLGRCSLETLRRRFFNIIKQPTHEGAIRYCCVDYDREMAVVAEYGEGDSSQIVGVARLVADPERTQAEFAILVIDDWQRRGVGGMLMDYLLGIAAPWGVTTIYAETLPENSAMIHMFRKRGFAVALDFHDHVVVATRATAAAGVASSERRDPGPVSSS